MARETTNDQGVEVEGSRGAGGGMLGRAEKVKAGAVVAEGQGLRRREGSGDRGGGWSQGLRRSEGGGDR